MIALVILGLLACALVVAWLRLDLANAPLTRTFLVAVGGGFLGALTLAAALLLWPPTNPPAWLIAMSDALLLFPLLLLSQPFGATNQTVLSLLAPVLLGIELSVVIFCVIAAARFVVRTKRRRAGLG